MGLLQPGTGVVCMQFIHAWFVVRTNLGEFDVSLEVFSNVCKSKILKVAAHHQVFIIVNCMISYYIAVREGMSDTCQDHKKLNS